MRYSIQLALPILSLWAFGCSPSGAIKTDANSQVFSTAFFDANAYDLSKVVCDGGDVVAPDHGIKASLVYKEAATAVGHNLTDVFSRYKQSSQVLFFNNFNVPTRMFSSGFVTPTNDLVKDDQGQTLIENFGLFFETELRLNASDSEGDYEFASLADDGVTVEMQMPTGEWKVLINNDGDHPTQMGCSFDSTTKKVHLVKEQAYPMRVHYYQGPRYHIANILMWRPARATRDSACGVSGNSTFFDPDHGSTPQTAYRQILQRGWSVIPADNFYLPVSLLNTPQNFNPCYTADAPVISDFAIVEVFPNQVIVHWKTDRLATSQAVVKSANGQAVIKTSSDNVLRTDHTVTISGLTFATSYEVMGISYSEQQGMAMTPTLTFTTP